MRRYLPHDAFEHAGAEFGTALVAEEEPSGAGVGEEGEHLLGGAAQVGGRRPSAADLGVVNENGVGGSGGVIVPPDGGEEP